MTPNGRTCSVVLTDRNDGYKDKDRARWCMLSFCDIYDEIWFIDWNTPKGKDPLLHSISDTLPKKGNIRHIVVDERLASDLAGDRDTSVGIPDVLCRNIAIRRTECDFLVSSAGIDIFGPSKRNFNYLIDWVDPNVFYTLSRRELDKDELYKRDLGAWRDALHYFSENSEPRDFPGQCTPNDWFSVINCCGDFQLASTKIWRDIKGFEENMKLRCFSDTNVQKKAILNRYRVEAIYEPPVFHISHEYGSMESERNNPMKWVEFFSKSENPDNWGFADREFEVEII